MGVWQWLREHIEKVTGRNPGVPVADVRLDSEQIAHLLQRAQEGGHWMLTPPKLLTLVHAVKQPIGSPQFTRLSVQHEPYGTKDRWGGVDEMISPDPNVLQTAPESQPTAASELTTMTAWRRPGSAEACLLGGLAIHAASTDKIELFAQWSDPFDDEAAPRERDKDENHEYRRRSVAAADVVPVPSTREGYIAVGRGTPGFRRVAYYDADHELLCFVRSGDRLGNLASGVAIHSDAAPRHYFDDTRYHKVTYTARATSRYREYFTANAALSEDEQAEEFTRTSEPVVVEVPASARPAAPQVSYVVPTFGWQRQTESNLKRSVRFGGGLRVYLDRPWFSSGDGELLGVTFYDYSNGGLTDRELWKPYVTQWGSDPIWESPRLFLDVPGLSSFPDAAVTTLFRETNAFWINSEDTTTPTWMADGSFLWLSGGSFSDFLIHNIDECCWMKNAWPVSAQASGGRHYRGDKVDQNFDSYSVEYTFADGAKPATVKWLSDMNQLGWDLKDKKLPQIEWQKKIEVLYAKADVADFLTLIDFDKLTHKLEMVDVGARSVQFKFPKVEGLSENISWGKQIFALKKGRSVVPHGHNNMATAFLILKGDFRGRHYDRVEDQKDHIVIKPTIDRRFGVGECSTVSDFKDNVHWFQSLSEPAFIFNIHVMGINPDNKEPTGRLYVDPNGEKLKGGLIRAKRIDYEDANKLYG
jgi:hypothetical protein